MHKSIFYRLFFCSLWMSFSCICCNEKKATTPSVKEVENSSIMSSAPLNALIIDGENNHGIWPKTTMMMKDYLESTGLFKVDINRKAFTWQGPHHNVEVNDNYKIEELLKEYPLDSEQVDNAVPEPKNDPTFSPKFSDYDVVINNLGWKSTSWTEKTKKAFEEYMSEGGGLVIIHAANNSFGDWNEYNKMIGLGGWGGRNTESGPYVYYNVEGDRVDDKAEGPCGSHGPQFEFKITTRTPDHPIMQGLPLEWLHTKDELYDRLRGPAINMTVLATAFSDKEKNGPPWNEKVDGTGRHEPMLFTVDYGKGRVFHTTLGHMDYSMECVGFITTLQRGAEWAATGSVSQAIPEDFPSAEKTSSRSWKL